MFNNHKCQKATFAKRYFIRLAIAINDRYPTVNVMLLFGPAAINCKTHN